MVESPKTGERWTFPDAEAFAKAAVSPARPWVGVVKVRELSAVKPRWPRKLVK